MMPTDPREPAHKREDVAPPATQPEPTPDAGAEPARPDVRAVPLARFLGYFLGLGTWGFGGPIATVGYMQRDVVERRGWVSRRDFLDGVALGQTMPGPLAAQVVMWLGFLRAGTLGALATAAAFIAPSFLLMLAVAVVYAHYQGLPVVQALFHGIAPAVMAIIAVAAYRPARAGVAGHRPRRAARRRRRPPPAGTRPVRLRCPLRLVPTANRGRDD
jgi:chromate transporter